MAQVKPDDEGVPVCKLKATIRMNHKISLVSYGKQQKLLHNKMLPNNEQDGDNIDS